MSVRTYGLIELSSQNPEEEYDITEEAEKVYEEFMKPKKETSDGE